MRLVLAGSESNRQPIAVQVWLSKFPTLGLPIDHLIVGGSAAISVAVEDELNTDLETQPYQGTMFYARSARFALTVGQHEAALANSQGASPRATLIGHLGPREIAEILHAVRAQPAEVQVSVGIERANGQGTCQSMLQCRLSELICDSDPPIIPDSAVTLMALDGRSGDWRRVPFPRQQTRCVTPKRNVLMPMERGLGNLATTTAISSIHKAPASALILHANAAAAAQLVARPEPAAQPSSVLIRPWTLEAIVIPDLAAQWHGPRVEDPSAILWPDDATPSAYWFPPEFEIKAADPSQPASDSSFRFDFHETGHDPQGRPTIEATVKFTLRRAKPATAMSRLTALGNPHASPVNVNKTAVSLIVPFRDEQGQLQRQSFVATIEDNGLAIVATVAVLNDWARLVYGALAIAGFQSEPPRVRVDYAFEAKVQVGSQKIPLIFSRKHQVLPDMLVTREPAAPVALPTRNGVAYFEREPQQSRGTALTSATALHSMVVKPDLATQSIMPVGVEPIWGIQTVGRTQILDCLFPCNTLGAFYIQTTPQGEHAIGCQDAFTLAQMQYRQYEEMTDNRIPDSIRLFRSLQQPGRFLIVPNAYRITRFAADAGERAFRPAAFLFSSLDATVANNNRCVLVMTLGPDFSPHEEVRLKDLAREWSSNPTMEYITEIQADVTFVWSIAISDIIRDNQALRHWDSFEVTIEVDLPQAPLLQSMLKVGSISLVARFALPDGTVLETTLRPDTSDIVGPPDTGPVTLQVANSVATATNRIDLDVDVDDIIVVAASGAPGASRIVSNAVNRTLKSGETAQIPLQVAADAKLVAAARPKSGAGAGLTEIRSFVEDIYLRIMFVNLINYANHQLQTLSLDVRLKDVDGQYSVQTSDTQPTSTIEIVLPLTTYLDHPTLQIQATITKTDQPSSQSNWIDWPLATQGNVISLTWDFLTNSPH